MRLRVNNVFDPDRRSYIERKLGALFQQREDLDGEARALAAPLRTQFITEVAESTLTTQVPVAPVEKHPALSDQALRSIEAWKRLALREVERESPLIEGERIEEDFFSFLADEWAGLPAKVAVLRRRTNLAEIVYFFECQKVSKRGLKARAPKRVKGGRYKFEAIPSGAEGAPSIDIARSLGEGLLSGFAGQIGALIFNAIFPPGVPSYFDAVYQEIRKIVRQEVTANTINIIDGQLNGIKDYVRNTYTPKRQSKTSRRELFKALAPYEHDCYVNVLGPLRGAAFAKPGFPVFMVGAGTLLAINQEQALVDPAVRDPKKSSYAETIRLNAKEFADFADDTYKQIRADRDAAVKLVPGSKGSHAVGTCDVITTKGWFWKDEVTGKSSKLFTEYKYKGKWHTGKEEAVADRKKYLAGVLKKLDTDLGKPGSTAAKWRKLVDRPLPPKKV